MLHLESITIMEETVPYVINVCVLPQPQTLSSTTDEPRMMVMKLMKDEYFVDRGPTTNSVKVTT